MRVRTATFTPGVYKIVLDEDLDGLCLFPDDVGGERTDLQIWINPNLKWNTLRKLDTIIHEALHAEFPKMSEEEVMAAGINISRLLWRLGYRWRNLTRASRTG